MKNINFTLFTVLMLTASVAWAADEEMMVDKPSIYASQSMTVSATVEAIDHETRVVTLRKPDGDEITLTVSDEVRNLDQVEVADIISSEYIETLSIVVMANDEMEPEAAEYAAMARAKEGEMPGMAVMDATVVTATLEEINLEMNTFKLKGPRGIVNEYVARNPDNLKRAAVGDLVVITTTQAMAIMVEERPAE
jgi:hypothetical protein